MSFYLIGPLVTLIPLGLISSWAFKPYCDDGFLGISPTGFVVEGGKRGKKHGGDSIGRNNRAAVSGSPLAGKRTWHQRRTTPKGRCRRRQGKGKARRGPSCTSTSHQTIWRRGGRARTAAWRSAHQKPISMAPATCGSTTGNARDGAGTGSHSIHIRRARRCRCCSLSLSCCRQAPVSHLVVSLLAWTTKKRAETWLG